RSAVCFKALFKRVKPCILDRRFTECYPAEDYPSFNANAFYHSLRPFKHRANILASSESETNFHSDSGHGSRPTSPLANQSSTALCGTNAGFRHTGRASNPETSMEDQSDRRNHSESGDNALDRPPV